MSNEKTIPTAWLIAHCRTFSDIPFSREIFTEFERIKTTEGQMIPDILKDTKLAPQFEARYKLVRRLLKQSDIKQILEIASGLSPRGLETCRSDKSIVYVETDFPELIEEKEHIIADISENQLDNLHFKAANALNLGQLQTACRYFDVKKEIAIVSEGLLRYLSFEEKTSVAKNIKMLLFESGGIWLTDISSHNSDKKQSWIRKSNNEIIKLTGVNTNDNLFIDLKHARRFFEELDFKVESHSYIEEIKNLTSPRVLNIAEDVVEEMLNTRAVFVLSIKK